MIQKRVNRWLANLVLIVGLLASASLTAQEEQTLKKNAKAIQVSTLALELLKDVPSIVIISGKTSSPLIELPTHGLSEAHPVASRTLTLAVPGEDDKPGRSLTKVTLPPKGKRFLLLLFPSKDSYLARVVRLDDPAFDAGKVCFFNVCSVPVGGTLGSTKFLAKPGVPVITAPPRQADLPYYQVKFSTRKGKRAAILPTPVGHTTSVPAASSSFTRSKKLSAFLTEPSMSSSHRPMSRPKMNSSLIANAIS